MANHGQPWFIKSINYNHGVTSHCEKNGLNMKIKHGPSSHCVKDYLNMKMNHGHRYHILGDMQLSWRPMSENKIKKSS